MSGQDQWGMAIIGAALAAMSLFVGLKWFGPAPYVLTIIAALVAIKLLAWPFSWAWIVAAGVIALWAIVGGGGGGPRTETRLHLVDWQKGVAKRIRFED